MKKYFFVCDESGAKGYSDKREKHFAELGVLAGFIVPEENLEKLRLALDPIKEKFLKTGKLHITDLEPADQEKLRTEIFEEFKKSHIICVYEAIHAEGFYDNYKRINKQKEKNKEQLRSKIKTSNNAIKESLHEKLFQGTFGKAVAVCIDHLHSGAEFHLEVITDRIDENIREQFESVAKELLSYGKEREPQKITGYDPEKKEIRTGTFQFQIENPNDVLGDFSGIQFVIKVEISSLTLAADVLVNSLYYFFENRAQKDKGSSLNTIESIKGHPLEALFLKLWNDESINWFSDAIFMHPVNVPDKET